MAGHPLRRAGMGIGGARSNACISGLFEEDTVRCQVSYTWRLSSVMASCDLYTAAEMRPRLADRGVSLSTAQLSRLISGTPLRISLPLLAALCDALSCTPSDLIVVSTE